MYRDMGSPSKSTQTFSSVKEVVRHEMPELTEEEVTAIAVAFRRTLVASGLEVYVDIEGAPNEQI